MKINQTVVDKIYGKLKEDIINLKIELGKRLNIQKMSEDFNVSQTPIREAVN